MNGPFGGRWIDLVDRIGLTDSVDRIGLTDSVRKASRRGHPATSDHGTAIELL